MLIINNDIKLGIADDNKFFRETLSDILSSEGFTIIFEAVNGYDCIEKIKSAKEMPDVCILDVFMPEMNGFETARIIKERWPEIKLIACSVNSETYIVEEILAADVDKFLSKGSEAADVINAILKWQTKVFCNLCSTYTDNQIQKTLLYSLMNICNSQY